MAGELMWSGRVVDGGLQTAVQEYRHPNGRSILMVGCVHMAEPDYYRDLRKIVDEAEASGATVYMEGTYDTVDTAPASDEELKAKRDERVALDKQFIGLPMLLDLPWVYQGESVLAPYPSTWKSNDASGLDMIRLVGPQNAANLAPSGAMYESFQHLKASKGADSLPYLMARAKWARSYIYQFKQWNRAARFLQRSIIRTRRIIKRITRTITRKQAPTHNGWMHPYIWTYRECIAALRALKTEGDVAMLWHPAHMPGIGRILSRNGFEPQAPSHWLTACHKFELTPGQKNNGHPQNAAAIEAGKDKGFTRGDAE